MRKMESVRRKKHAFGRESGIHSLFQGHSPGGATEHLLHVALLLLEMNKSSLRVNYNILPTHLLRCN